MNIQLDCSSLWNYSELGSIAVYYSMDSQQRKVPSVKFNLELKGN